MFHMQFGRTMLQKDIFIALLGLIRVKHGRTKKKWWFSLNQFLLYDLKHSQYYMQKGYYSIENNEYIDNSSGGRARR